MPFLFEEHTNVFSAVSNFRFRLLLLIRVLTSLLFKFYEKFGSCMFMTEKKRFLVHKNYFTFPKNRTPSIKQT
jgi:hypothetical protein